jgi:uncharacterized protein (DUF39 family)
MTAGTVLKIIEIAGTALGVIAFALVTYWRLKEKRHEERLDLADNPVRCGEHKARLESLEARMDENHEEHVRIFAQLQALSVEIAKLSRNGGGAK